MSNWKVNGICILTVFGVIFLLIGDAHTLRHDNGILSKSMDRAIARIDAITTGAEMVLIVLGLFLFVVFCIFLGISKVRDKRREWHIGG